MRSIFPQESAGKSAQRMLHSPQWSARTEKQAHESFAGGLKNTREMI